MQEEQLVQPEGENSTTTLSFPSEFIVPFGVRLAEEAVAGNPTNTGATSTHTNPNGDSDTDTD